MVRGTPIRYDAIEEHFKYGSVGSDNLKGGLPYWILKALPEVFHDHRFLNGTAGYTAFGLIVEPGMDRPVGFSKRRIGTERHGLDMVGMNCAACHASTVRISHDQADHHVILGMPGHTVDVEKFFLFLFETAKDKRFTTHVMIEAIDRQMKKHHETMGLIDRMMYWGLIHLYRWEIGKLEQKFCFLHGVTNNCKKKLPSNAGPGRIDTWAPYKVLTLQAWPPFLDVLPHLMPRTFDFPDMELGDAPGFADIPSLWNLEHRLGRGFHWDGNTVLLAESSITAAVGSGATPAVIDLDGLHRTAVWLRTYSPPKYDGYAPIPERVDEVLNRTGKMLYVEHCATCHSREGSRFGHIEPIESIGTDRDRLNAFTDELAGKLNTVGRGYDWRLQKFTKTHGYSNVPLDGLWLRAPYLHNGSVPTLRHLLQTPEHRPQTFYRGNDLYDWKNVGFTSDVKQQGHRKFFLYDTRLRGNGNGGHLAGTTLSEKEKEALLEYLKTL